MRSDLRPLFDWTFSYAGILVPMDKEERKALPTKMHPPARVNPRRNLRVNSCLALSTEEDRADIIAPPRPRSLDLMIEAGEKPRFRHEP